MEIIRGIHNLRARHQGCVATIGNFDGVHRGHQAVLRLTRERAREHGAPSTVILFEPQPLEFFAAENAPARLHRLREKLECLESLGLERVLCLRFNRALADMEAAHFVQRVLVQGLGVRHLIVGDDFHFGHRRQGNFALLQTIGAQVGFAVEATPSLTLDEHRVSSTAIRDALQVGDLDAAARLLGRPYRIGGHVVRGDQRGRTLGFPTANVLLKRRVVPVRGVFAVRVHCLGPTSLPAMANIGNRPTVGGVRTQLEVHLFDISQDLYGRYIEVEFVRYLRPEQRFQSLDALKSQLALDEGAARAALK
ncbi:MAG: bifunctional riboflavin kinase/FAD synthetase [Gammaproteobacteria bacterium]|nr:bifunctional riboflavin kinase/FAD synthetase [Gammaproteobacteria bacterium]